MDMIEKVAKTICETGNVAGFRCTCPHPIDGWCNGARAVAQARAAIEAMREPTEEMVRAGLTSLAVTAAGLPEFEPKDEAELCFSAMIDAALTGGK